MALDASALPQVDDGHLVKSNAASVVTAIDKIATRAVQVKFYWGALSANYDAPESGLVLQAMDEPQTQADQLSTKAGTARTALDTYGDRLIELEAERASLVSDINSFNASADEQRSDSWSGFAGWRDWTGWEAQDLLNQEEALNDRVSAFAASLDEAQRTCANAISAIYGGPEYSAADRTSVDDPYVYGLSEDGYDQMSLSGENAWGSPRMWTDTSWMSSGYQLGRGAVRSLADIVDLASTATGIGAEDGETEAFWSGMWQLTKDVGYLSTPALLLGITSPQQAMESGERLLNVGKSAIGIGTWTTSGWNTAGGFVPDVALAIVTAGGGAAVKGGVRGIARGALDAILGRHAPSGAVDVADLNAVRHGLNGRSDGLNTLDDVDLRTLGSEDFPDLPTDSGRPGVPGTTTPDGPGATTPDGPGSTSPGRPGATTPDGPGATTPEAPGATTPGGSTPEAPGATTPGGTAPGSPSPGPGQYAGDPGSGMRGGPPQSTTSVAVRSGDDLMPRSWREPFGRSGDLAPSTRYDVPDHGTYWTDADGRIAYVEPTRVRNGGGQQMSPELRDPLPEVTYKVDGAYFHTDHLGRTDHIHVPDLQRQAGPALTDATRNSVVGGKPDTDAGHLWSRMFGGIREEINVVPMPRDLNQGNGGRSLLDANSVWHLEQEIARVLDETHGNGGTLSLDLRPQYLDDTRTPAAFQYETVGPDGVIDSASDFILNE